MKGYLSGVFGTRQEFKASFENSIAKKSETEGIIVYSRNESGMKYSFLDDATFPDKIQGYARIASICDHAYYVFPNDGKLTPADGELAILVDALGLPGSIELIDAPAQTLQETIKTSFKGMSLSNFPIEERSGESSVVNLTGIRERPSLPSNGTLVYIDRAFNVKGVGLVVLGFILCGRVSVHDKLRLIPGTPGKFAEVKGIQISDEDYENAERGIRVGLSLKGVELKDLEKTSWLDDGSLNLAKSLTFNFAQSKYYKQPTIDRDIHLECNGELLVARIRQGSTASQRIAELAHEVPFWEAMPVCALDLNSKPLRVVGGGSVIV